jgi:hypothetical protein
MHLSNQFLQLVSQSPKFFLMQVLFQLFHQVLSL